MDKAASTYIIDCIIPDLCSNEGVAIYEYACVTLTASSYLPTPTYQYNCRSVFTVIEVGTCSVEHASTNTLTHEVRSWYQQITSVSVLFL